MTRSVWSREIITLTLVASQILQNVKNCPAFFAPALSRLRLFQEYFSMKKKIISSENRILRELAFVLHVEHPHKFILFFCRMLAADGDREGNRKFAQTAWNILNDRYVPYRCRTVGQKICSFEKMDFIMEPVLTVRSLGA